MTRTVFGRGPGAALLFPQGSAGTTTIGRQSAAGLATLFGALESPARIAITADPRDPVRVSSPAPGEPAALLCCSAGSTGGPKTVIRSHGSWIASFEVNRHQFALGPADVYATLGALSHSLTLYASLEAMDCGAGLVALAGVRPDRQLRLLDEFDVSVLYATPAQLGQLIRAAGGVVLPAMRLILAGGGALGRPCRDDLANLCPGADIREFYGASETSFISLTDASTPAGSVGRCYPGVSLDIRDASGRSTTGIGEIWVKSPYLFDGYEDHHRPGTDAVWRDGYLSIGEMGFLDPGGNLYAKGRKRRMVTIMDRNVFPEDCERIIMRDPAVSACAVVPVADPRRGHRLVGFVQGADDGSLADRLCRACRDELGPHAAPRQVRLVAQLPMLAAGKPDLAALQIAAESG